MNGRRTKGEILRTARSPIFVPHSAAVTRTIVPMPARTLALLERMRDEFSPGAGARKLAALRRLASARLATAGQVRRLHETLCFLRAYPDDAALLRQIESMLRGFAARHDLRVHRDELADSGIAGTAVHYPFFYPTARWIAARWPEAFRLDRSDTLAGESIGKVLPALLSPLEAHGLREGHLDGYPALDAVRGERSDATFFVERIVAMPGDERVREALYDLVNPSCVLLGSHAPARTTAVYGGGPRVWQSRPLRHDRPDLRAEIARPPRSLRRLGLQEGRTLVTLAREAMITRQRDLDAFAHGHEADVWLADDGHGLAFVLIGTQPERRTALAAIYGGLTLQNGVPVGYHQTDFLGRSAAISFNTFETFRGGESAHTLARLLATVHAFAGPTTFSIEPYQLGADNDEGIASGAWWFYFKLGFRPRARAALQLAGAELRRLRARPGRRSTPATLRRLAAHHLFFELDPVQTTPLLLPGPIGVRIAAHLAGLAAGDRASANELAEAEARHCCGLASLRGFTRNERSAWQRLAPLFAALPLHDWTPGDCAALIRLARAKGARSERRYAQLLAQHRPLERALAAWHGPRVNGTNRTRPERKDP